MMEDSKIADTIRTFIADCDKANELAEKSKIFCRMIDFILKYPSYVDGHKGFRNGLINKANQILLKNYKDEFDDEKLKLYCHKIITRFSDIDMEID